jgi:hypothetical protein
MRSPIIAVAAGHARDHVLTILAQGVVRPGPGHRPLMRAIVGVQIVAGGTVDVLGLPAGAAVLRSRVGRHARERVGYVTQAPSVYWDLTVLENLRYFDAIVGAGPRARGRGARYCQPRRPRGSTHEVAVGRPACAGVAGQRHVPLDRTRIGVSLPAYLVFRTNSLRTPSWRVMELRRGVRSGGLAAGHGLTRDAAERSGARSRTSPGSPSRAPLIETPDGRSRLPPRGTTPRFTVRLAAITQSSLGLITDADVPPGQFS